MAKELKKIQVPKPPSLKSQTTSAAPPAPILRKDFRIGRKNAVPRGKKIVLYGESGIGKSTLSSMLPNPVFIDLDNGCAELTHPKTGEPLIDRCFQDVKTFEDVRGLLQSNAYDSFNSLIIDNVTVLETLAVQYVLKTVKAGNQRNIQAADIEHYGWGKGYRHLYDHMNLILQDLDVVLDKGINVCLLAQSSAKTVPNPDGDDYLREGPRLCNAKNNSVEDLYCEWADHLLRIGYQMISVQDRKASSTGARAVFCKGQPHFRAKSRTLDPTIELVTFDGPADDSIWQFIFGATRAPEESEAA